MSSLLIINKKRLSQNQYICNCLLAFIYILPQDYIEGSSIINTCSNWYINAVSTTYCEEKKLIFVSKYLFDKNKNKTNWCVYWRNLNIWPHVVNYLDLLWTEYEVQNTAVFDVHAPKKDNNKCIQDYSEIFPILAIWVIYL